MNYGDEAPDYSEILMGFPAEKRELVRRAVIQRNNNTTVFIATEDDSHWAPYRLVPYPRAGDKLRNVSMEIIIDSAVMDQNKVSDYRIANKKIIEAAKDINADYVVPKDYPEDDDLERTHESIKHFIRIFKQEGLVGTAEPIIPLQQKYADHWNCDPKFYSQFTYFGAGGLKDEKPEAQLQGVEAAREVVGPHNRLHGFGMGCSETLIQGLVKDKSLLDSLDTSTPETAPGNYGAVVDATFEQHSDGFTMPDGKYSGQIRGCLTEFVTLILNKKLSDPPELKFEDDQSEQANLSNFTTSSELENTTRQNKSNNSAQSRQSQL